MNIITTLAIDDHLGMAAHYPQIPYVNARDRRLVYWRCVCVFFLTSLNVNPQARHLLITNDKEPPVIGGVHLGRFLAKLGVEIHTVPFVDFKPTVEQSKVFRNNFYKLAALAYVLQNSERSTLLFDSDIVWLNPWPKAPSGLHLYKAFVRPASQKEPTGISSHDLCDMYESLGGASLRHPVHWCGGEFIAGDNVTLREFMAQAIAVFHSWQEQFDPSAHRFANGASVFDNDEFLLSRVALDWTPEFTPDLKRVWTEDRGGGDLSHRKLAALHLPNEKLTGIAGLFDCLVMEEVPVTIELLTDWCGIPARRHEYRSRSRWIRTRKGILAALKSSMPRPAYNILRSIFGRSPI